jgi:hypothetical protein
MFHLIPLGPADLAYVLFVASWGLFFVLPEFFAGKKFFKWQ